MAETEPNNEVSNEKRPEEKDKGRGEWNNPLEFILTIVGYAVGLGNVWRFPYLAFKNGGGAFLVPYVLMLIFCGIPVFFFELCFGQFASLGALAIWTVNPLMKGIGVCMTFTSIMVTLSYHILLAYILFFFFASMQAVVPWTHCDNLWNTYQCLTVSDIQNDTYLNWYLNEYNLTRQELKTPSEEYFYNEVLKLSSGIDEVGGIVWQLALTLLLAWLIVFLVLIRGIESLGKVVYFTTLFPYIMMTVMVVRGATLDGAIDGVIYYLKPDFTKLNNAVVWSDAASQIFYSLSTCSGGLIAMASYNKFHNNVQRDSIMVPIINCTTSLYAGFSIFSVLGFMAKLKNVPVSEVAASGPGLVFVVYPEGLSQMPVAPLWSILFFLMMATLGFSSAFSMVEAIFVAYIDEFADYMRVSYKRQFIFRVVGCSCGYLISLVMVTNGGFYIFNIIDTYTGGLPRLFTGVFELIGVIWMYGLGRFSQDVSLMLGHQPNCFFKATWSVISPVVVIFILLSKIITHEVPTLFNGAYVYPKWADTLGWCLVALVMVWLPLLMLYRWMLDGGWQALKKAATPLPNWGPADPANRTGPYADYDLRSTSSYATFDNLGSITLGKSGSTYDMSRMPSKVSFSLANGSVSNKQNGFITQKPNIEDGDVRLRPAFYINTSFEE